LSAVSEAVPVERVRESAPRYKGAIVLAFAICGLFTLAGLLVPPTLSHDPAWGMQEWRSYRAGNPINTVTHPDVKDISRDQADLLTWWSPGQYLVPGALTLLGFRLGTALSIVAGASLLCCLLGWIQVGKHFALSPRIILLLVACIGTFRYSTLPFGVYNGGEILLQGFTPWLILAACSIPSMSALRAAGLACLAILIAFFLKLTGVMVASVAFFACGLEALIRLKRVTVGMIAGAFGAIVAFAILYGAWFSRGSTPASGTGWSFRAADVLFAWGAPWGAGVSWTDMFTSLMLNFRHPVLSGSDAESGNLAITIWLLVIPTLLFLTILVQGWRRRSQDENLARLLQITIFFYAAYALAMSAIFLRGGDVSLEERHLRAAGMLIFVCALATASRLRPRSPSRLSLGALCALMSLYGCFAFAYRARSTKRSEIDHYSGTYQPSVDESAIEFLRTTFAQQGRDALIVLPSPEAASAFSPSVRILTNHIEFEPEETISSRTYRGKVRGSVYVVVPARMEQSVKTTLLLKEFIDYPLEGWEKRSFGSSIVFVQPATSAPK
jgi:hypothetical protein